jgi:hypothetical protein
MRFREDLKMEEDCEGSKWMGVYDEMTGCMGFSEGLQWIGYVRLGIIFHR